MKSVAIVLAAGTGSRMKAAVPKQFLMLAEKPVLYYCLKAFEDSQVDEVILVAGEEQVTYCEQEVVACFHFKKVKRIVGGGLERFNSVYNGIQAVDCADYILVHDGARPFITSEIINNLLHQVKKYKACVAAVPVKDTIKLSDSQGYVTSTLDRNVTWQIQTPQVFEYELIKSAYEKLIVSGNENVTDDAMVIETYSSTRVKLIQASYKNIKITTPEDLLIANAFLSDG